MTTSFYCVPQIINVRRARAFLIVALTVIGPVMSFGQLGRAKITQESQVGSSLPKPAVIYVTDFSFDPSQLQSSNPLQSGPLRQRLNSLRGVDTSPEGRAKSIVNLMADSIVRDLQAKQLNAERASIRVSPQTGWIVKGRYKTLEQGSRVASSEVGFGAGSPLVQVEVTLDQVHNGRQRPILLFGTNKENSKAPGGVAMSAATHNPYAMAIKFVRSRNDLERSIQQTAKLIADQIARKAGV
ncbi:MAG: DUF4410 domain-containing protein [Verrucomicrobia bacterium]|nr:DUF4410 domain-containing protein [Verrucomicrobiota bacterium]